MKYNRSLLFLSAVFITAWLLSSCSTKKNTGMSRWWHSFTARYNTVFNGEQAFIEGNQAKAKGHKDNYTEMLPVFLVGNKQSQSTGKGQFETTITKCRKAIVLHSIKRRPQISPSKRRSAKMRMYLQRKEFNPFLKHAWLLMGQAQFEKGDFLEAASTFSYITRLYTAEPAVAAEARQWLARCYAQINWFYDAEDALSKMRRDSVAKRVLREADATQADLLLRQERFADAIPYLERAAKYAHGDFRKARLYFLLGQVYNHLGNNQMAYKSLARCIRKSPPFELSFNARILQTELLANNPRASKKMITRLKHMARSSNNKEFLDQVYYAMGNIYLNERDTTQAISAYETGRVKATRAGAEKGRLLLRLGELYWDLRKFSKAKECYTEALSMIEKTRDDYELITRRSTVLDKLVPFTEAIALQDSLQELSRMNETDRNAAIDRVIEALKKKEEEQRQASLDSAANARAESNNINSLGGVYNSFNPNRPSSNKKNQIWYFYNPTNVMQGKQDFAKQWGKRKNEDNWRRSNRTVVAIDNEEGYDYEADDSLQAAADSLAALNQTDEPQTKADSLANDPHNREFYLAQIPFTPEARAASDEIIKDALFNAGLIEKDDLEDFELAASTLGRLTTQYTEFDRMAEAYYHLFLLYSRWNKPNRADQIRNHMAAAYPEHELTRLITDPDFEHNARYGKEIEDSLYTATYKAYRRRDNAEVARNFAYSTQKYPTGLNRPKFILIHALSRLGKASTKELTTELRQLVQDFPESDVSQLAGMLIKGLEGGRQIGTGTFDLGSLWDRRTAEADSAATDANQQKQFSAERNVPFFFILAYPTDSINADKLLYEMAHFNFSSFVVRGFDMNIVRSEGISQFRIAGFNSYDEAHTYARRCFESKSLYPYLKKGRIVLISKQNLDLLGTLFSFNDYQKFFDKTFAPIELKPNLPIEQIMPVEQRYEDELTPEELERINNGESQDEDTVTDEEGEWY